MTPSVNATLPTGNSAGIYNISGDVATLDVNGPTAISWDSFSIGRDNTLIISGGDTLNRVLSGVTRIDGLLSSDSQVFIINPNGVVVGPNGAVDAAGFVASDLDIADSDFLSGTLQFSGATGAGVSNAGVINAGLVVLVGSEATNSGSIDGGEVVLGGAEGYLYIDPASGDWSADGAGVAVNTGDISASGVEFDGGRVMLVTSLEGGSTANSGNISVDGGFVETSGTSLALTNFPSTNGGEWLIDPPVITVTDSKEDGDPLASPFGSGDIGDDVISNYFETNGTLTLEALGGTDDIEFASGSKIAPKGNGTLIANAGNDIIFNGAINKRSTSELTVNFTAGNDIILQSIGGDNVKIDTGTNGNINLTATAGNISIEPDVGKIQLDSRGGDITMSAGTSFVVDSGSGGGQVQMFSRGGNISITANDFDVSVPSGGKLQIFTGNGSTPGGDLTFTSNVGDIIQTTGGGGSQIQIKTFGGAVSLDSAGSIDFDLAATDNLQIDSGTGSIPGGAITMTAVGSIEINADAEGKRPKIDSRGGDISLTAFTATDVGTSTLSNGVLNELNNLYADNSDNDIVLNASVRSRGGNIRVIAQGDIIVGAETAPDTYAAFTDKVDIRGDGGAIDLLAVGDIDIDSSGFIRTGVGGNAIENSIRLRGDAVELIDTTVDARGGLITVFATSGLGDTATDSDILLDVGVGKGSRLRTGSSDNNNEDVGGVVMFADDSITLAGANNVIDGRGSNVSIVAGGDFDLQKRIKTQTGRDNLTRDLSGGEGTVLTVSTPNNETARGDVVIAVGGNYSQTRDTENDDDGKGRGAIDAENGNVILDVEGDILLASSKNAIRTKTTDGDVDGNITVTADGNIYAVSSIATLRSGGDIKIESTGGSIFVGGDNTTAINASFGAGLEDIRPDSNIKIGTATRDTGGSIQIIAEDSITFAGDSNVARKNKVEVRTGGTQGDLYILAKTGDIKLEAPEPATAADGQNNGVKLRSNGYLRMYAPSGDITAIASDASENTDMEIRVDGDELDMVAGGDIIFQAGDAAKSDVIARVSSNDFSSETNIFAAGDILFSNGDKGARAFLGQGGKFGNKDTSGGTVVSNVTVKAGGDIQLAQDLTVSQNGIGELQLIADAEFNKAVLSPAGSFSSFVSSDNDGVGAFITNLATRNPGDSGFSNAKSIYLRSGNGDITVSATGTSTRDELSDGTVLTAGALVDSDFFTAEGSHAYNGGSDQIPDNIATIGYRSEGGAISITGLGHTIINETSRMTDNDLTITSVGAIAINANLQQKGNSVDRDSNPNLSDELVLAAGDNVNGDVIFREKTQIQSTSSGVPATNVEITGGGDLNMEVFDNKNQISLRGNGGDLTIAMTGSVETPRVDLDLGAYNVTSLDSAGIVLGRTDVIGTALITSSGPVTQNERFVIDDGGLLLATQAATVFDVDGDITLQYNTQSPSDPSKTLNEFGSGIQVLNADDVAIASKISMVLVGPSTMDSANLYTKGTFSDEGAWTATVGDIVVNTDGVSAALDETTFIAQ